MSLAFMFPGQGSQSVGMLQDLAEVNPAIAQTFAEASEALGEDLWALCSEGPAEELDRTENTQPALLTASVAVYRAWSSAGGGAPSMVAGHSLGEYSALVVAQALELEDAVRLVRRRGELMQQAVPAGAGAMAAILGLDDDAVARCCAEAAGDGVVSAANFNAPGQVVIAGDADAIERAVAACKEAGAKRAMPLAVSVPSHCALMKPAAEAFADALGAVTLRAPSMPVVQNVTARSGADVEVIRQALIDQMHSPVRWTDCVLEMKRLGAERLLECGPGKVLSGMIKRIDRDLTAGALGSADALAAALGDS